ncbi:MAG: hypothetical protein HYR80_01405, partial [Nitrospirae bacterium]|nr:hypothetical protein [Nitrospirota bacterium]
MKKFLNLFFAAVLILVSAESLYAADLKVNGEYRVRGYSYSSVTGQDYGQGDSADYIDQRFLLTGTVTQGMTSGIAELDLNDSKPWGDPANPGYGAKLASKVHQAYLNVTFANANLMAGKRNIQLGHGIILNDTADNIAVRIPLQMLSIDLAYLKLNEPDSLTNTHLTTNDLDRNGFLINLGIKPTDTLGLGLFLISDSRKLAGGFDNDVQNVIGLTLDGQMGPLGVVFEYDHIGGTASNALTAPTACAGAAATCNYKGQNILLAAHANVGVAEVG